MAFDVKTLPDYVQQNANELIVKSVATGKTVEMLTLLADVVGPRSINKLTASAVFQDGKGCGFNPSGDAYLSQRVLTPRILKVNEEFCPDVLIDKYTASLVNVGAGRENLPYETQVANEIVASVNEQLETMIWQGDSENGVAFDGFIKLMQADTDVIKLKDIAGAYNALKATYMAIPSSIISKSDTVIFCGEDTFRAFIQDLIAANLYHYNPSDVNMEYVLPGTGTRVIGVAGLNETGKIVATRLSNLFYGTDLMTDKDEWKLWFDEGDDIFKLKIKFAAGVQYGFGEEIVMCAMPA